MSNNNNETSTWMKPIWKLSRKQIFLRVLALLPLTIFLGIRIFATRPDFEPATTHLLAVAGVIGLHILLLIITFIRWKKEN
ncbi:hypothetical protein [Bacillus marasmi]|uniref:hypothetical protein n=1 Tax=Bacillus marasmi TaxID=1926279 RepID=UPI0011C87066|nr:hypothetical protein [Bacillus marasmi]